MQDRRRVLAIAWLFAIAIASDRGYADDLFVEMPLSRDTADPARATRYYVDEASELDLTHAVALADSFKPLPTASPSFGYSDASYWFTFTIRRGPSDDRDLLLVFRVLHLDHLDVAFIAPDGRVLSRSSMGDAEPHGTRRYATWFPSAEIPVAQDLRVVVNIRSAGSVQFNAAVETRPRYARSEGRLLLFGGFIYGIAIVMIGFHLLLWVMSREAVYLRYLAYLVTWVIFLTVYLTIGEHFIWRTVGLQNFLHAPAIALLVGGFLQFASIFNDLPRARGFRALAAVTTAIIAAVLVLDIAGQTQAALMAANASAVVALLATAYGLTTRLAQGSRSARRYLIGWSGYIAGGALIALSSFGIVDDSWLASIVILLGFVVEVLILSSSLASRLLTLQATVVRQWEELARNDHLAALGTLSASVVHEAAGPNHAMGLNAQFLHGELSRVREEEGCVEVDGLTEAVASASDIVDTSHALAATLGSMREFGRMPEEHSVEFDLCEQLRATLRLYRRTLDHEITVALDLPHAPVYGRGVPIRFQQAVANLLRNAAQAIGTPGRREAVEGRIDVVLALRDNEAVLEVRDNGCGISAEHVARITEPFFSTRRRTGGTGLGLTICDQVVREMGGRLAVASAPGAGTSIYLHMPTLSPDHHSAGNSST